MTGPKAKRGGTARDDLVRAHLPLADYLARRFGHRGEPLEDLVQVASVALVKAADRYDSERGTKFSTFATLTIVGELKRYFRDKGWALKAPRRVQELHLLISRSLPRLTQELGRSPTIAEIAGDAGASEDECVEAIEADRSYRLASLDAPAPGPDGDGGALSSKIGAEDPDLAEAEDRALLESLLGALPERERRVIYLRFYDGLTQTEIAEQIGASQMHVSRLLARGMEALRKATAAAGMTPCQEGSEAVR